MYISKTSKIELQIDVLNDREAAKVVESLAGLCADAVASAPHVYNPSNPSWCRIFVQLGDYDQDGLYQVGTAYINAPVSVGRLMCGLFDHWMNSRDSVDYLEARCEEELYHDALYW